MKTLLFAISTIILLLFTSCEDEMGKGGGTGGGGMQNENTIVKSTPTLTENDTILVPDVILEAD